MSSNKIGIAIKINGIFALAIVGIVSYELGKRVAINKLKDGDVNDSVKEFVENKNFDN